MAAAEWSEKTRLAVTLTVVAVINLGIWYFVWRGREEWKKQDAKLVGLRKDTKALEERAAQKPDLERVLDKLKRENERREKKLPEAHERAKFIDVLREQALKTRLRVRNVNIDEIDKPPDVPGINPANFVQDVWKISAEADFKSMCEFLNTMEEHYIRFVSIQNLRIIPREEGMGVTGIKHDLSFDVATYRYKRTE